MKEIQAKVIVVKISLNNKVIIIAFVNHVYNIPLYPPFLFLNLFSPITTFIFITPRGPEHNLHPDGKFQQQLFSRISLNNKFIFCSVDCVGGLLYPFIYKYLWL